MNNLIQNYEIILKELNNTCSHIVHKPQIRKPKLLDIELVALNLTAEYMSIISELQLFRCIKGTVLENKIERSVYNKRKRNLFGYIENIRKCLSDKFSSFTIDPFSLLYFRSNIVPFIILITIFANAKVICTVLLSPFQSQSTAFQFCTKHEISWYPELKKRMPKQRKAWQTEPYTMSYFDALALFVTHKYLS